MNTTLKTTIALFVIPLLIIVTGFTKSKCVEVTIKTVFYCDHFSQCESRTALEKEIMLTAGIKSVSIDASAMTIKVKFNPKQTNIDKIRSVISKAGYDADEVKADEKAYEKLDGCCKKKD